MNYIITTEPAKMNTITISKKQLWDNFVNAWRDMLWDDYTTFCEENLPIKKVAKILCQQNDLDYNVRSLFREGLTCFLMGDAMKYIDLPDSERNTLIEIVVVDGDQKLIVEHGDICY